MKARGPSAPGKRQQQIPIPTDAPVHPEEGKGDQGQGEVLCLPQGHRTIWVDGKAQNRAPLF